MSNIQDELSNSLAGIRAETHSSTRAVDNLRMELETLDLNEKRVIEVTESQRQKLINEIAALDAREQAQLDDIRTSRAIIKKALDAFDGRDKIIAKSKSVSVSAEKISDIAKDAVAKAV